jgi:hypothetical protein
MSCFLEGKLLSAGKTGEGYEREGIKEEGRKKLLQ